MTGAYCTSCGRAVPDVCDGRSCRRPLDPPRYCAACGQRLAVLVTPTGVDARCRRHGRVPAGAGEG